MVYIMVYTMWYTSLELWYIPSKSGLYHGSTFQMTRATRRQSAMLSAAFELCDEREPSGATSVQKGHEGAKRRSNADLMDATMLKFAEAA
jgi:hypothetical protein